MQVIIRFYKTLCVIITIINVFAVILSLKHQEDDEYHKENDLNTNNNVGAVSEAKSIRGHSSKC